MKLTSSILATASLVALSTAAFAQEVQTPEDALTPVGAPAEPGSEPEDDGTIVVTGTQIRGIKPVGSNVLSQSQEEIKATGVNDANQLLSQLPQSEFFMGLPQPGSGPRGGTGAIIAGSPRSPINRPNLRNLPGTNDSSGQSTLVLMDGHRIVPAGIEQAGVDAGVVPVSVLERTEVILDGVSAVYGSDAVGGVINYITRKRYDGLRVSARYGVADDYWQTDASVTAGKTWETGGITLNYEFAQNSDILNRDRPFAAALNWLIPDPTSPGNFVPPQLDDQTCDIANLQNRTSSTPPGVFHAEGAGLVAGPAFCDAGGYVNYNPAQKRHAGFLVFQQEIGEAVTFDVTALYTKRTVVSNAGPFTATAVIAPTNPYYRCNIALTGTCTGVNATQRVSFSYGPIFGNDTQRSTTAVELWHVTPEVTAKLGGDWQARVLVGHGRSNTTVDQVLRDAAVQTALFNGTTFATAINPYDITDSRQNRTLIDSMLKRGFTQGKQRFTQVRAVADGPLFAMPGGEVRVAIGAEWQKHGVSVRRTDALTFAVSPFFKASTSNKAAFAELVVPIVGADNASPGLHSLVLSASGRYDDYGRYGTTFNPKLAATYMPFDWITLRANWGTSFRAPNAIDKLQAETGTLLQCVMQAPCASAVFFTNPTIVNPNYNFTATGNTFTGLTLAGTIPNLRPETSESWSIGADIEPPFVPGLKLSASYFHISFENQIARPNTGGSLNSIFQSLPNLYTICYAPPAASQPNNAATQASLCTPAQIQAFAAQAPNGQAVLNSIQGFNVAYLVDTRIRNLGGAKVTGVDLSGSYRRDVGFGSIDANVNVTLPMSNKTQLAPGGAYIDQLLTGEGKFLMTASAGVNSGGFRAQATWRHRSSYLADEWLCLANPAIACAATPTRHPNQKRIRAFNVVDLSFRYNFDDSGMLGEGLQLSLNVNNVFDAHPALSQTTNGGAVGGQTLGRLFQVGLTKEF